MAFEIADRVKETTTTTGTGNITLAGAVTGFQTFNAALNSGATCPYVIAAGAEWEVGLGTFTSPATLARTTVLASSNADAAVNFSAGTKMVALSLPAAYALLTKMALPIMEGLLQVDGGLKTDTIAEKTAAAGVTIDGLLLKDGAVGTNGVVAASITALAVTLAKLATGTRGGLIHYADGSGTPTDSGAGTDGHVWTAGGAGANAGWEALPAQIFSTSFVSTAIDPNAPSDGNQAHGLGGQPSLAMAKLVCIDANKGYAVGDTLWLSTFDGAGSNYGFSVWSSATAIGYSVGTSGIRVPGKTDNSVSNISPGDWELYLVAIK